MATSALTGMRRPGARTEYLALALDARVAMKALRIFASTRERPPELISSLKTVTDSLKAIAPPNNKRLYSELHSEGRYAYFEQIRTLQEVASTLNDTQLLQRLEAILEGTSTEAEDVRAVVRFFSAVEDRALYHYNDPVLGETSS